MHVLFLSRWFPYPPNNGSKLRILELLRGLSTRHQVTLLCFADDADCSTDTTELQSICDRIHVVPWREYNPSSWRSRFGYFSANPRSMMDTFSPQMAREIERLQSAESIDLVIGSELEALNYASLFREIPALLEDPELGVLHGRRTQSQSMSRRIRARLSWFKLRQYMVRQMKCFRAATVVSEEERRLLSKVAPDLVEIEVVPNCISCADYSHVNGNPDPDRLIFTGPFGYVANYDAMTWFLRSVYPLIQEEDPRVTLVITGDHRNLPLPSANNVTLTGFVEDVRPLIAEAWCSIAPIRTGGGTRLKILEAMALHTPVVATSKGAEGLEVEHDVHLLIADTPHAFADATLRLLHEPGLRERLAYEGYELVRRKYDWSAVMRRFLDLVDRVAET